MKAEGGRRKAKPRLDAQSALGLRIRQWMRRNLMASLTLGLILAFAAFHQAQAGERRSHLPIAAHGNSKVQNPNSKGETANHLQGVAVMSGGPSGVHPSVARLRSNVAGEFSFSAVSPLASKSAVGNEPTAHATFVAAQAKEAGPATAPSERKAVTFFRLNPKFGDVSVQPMFGGGVNGAQLAVGF
jgi:hypothetical protein